MQKIGQFSFSLKGGFGERRSHTVRIIDIIKCFNFVFLIVCLKSAVPLSLKHCSINLFESIQCYLAICTIWNWNLKSKMEVLNCHPKSPIIVQFKTGAYLGSPTFSWGYPVFSWKVKYCKIDSLA